MAKSTTSSQFPQISRVISEMSSFFKDGPIRASFQSLMLVVLMGGVCLFIILNMVHQMVLPTEFIQLLNNPYDVGLLSKLYARTNDAEVKAQVRSQLEYMQATNVLSDIQKTEASNSQKLQALAELSSSAPAFPDAYAYAASLYLKDRNCPLSLKSLQQALNLDPNREEFKKLQASVRACK